MENSALHIVFGSSPAGTLRQAFFERGRREKVLHLMEDFSIGPIASNDPEARLRWAEQELAEPDWHEIIDGDAELPGKSRSSQLRIIAWFAPNRASSYAGFLWWLSKIGSTPCYVMGVPDLNFYHTEAMLALVGNEADLPDVDRTHYHLEWQRLRNEDASLRVIYEDKLISVEANYFDDFIIGYITPEWQETNRVVDRSVGDLSIETGHFVNDLYVYWRLRTLARIGALEWDGDLNDRRHSKLRLVLTG